VAQKSIAQEKTLLSPFTLFIPFPLLLSLHYSPFILFFSLSLSVPSSMYYVYALRLDYVSSVFHSIQFRFRKTSPSAFCLGSSGLVHYFMSTLLCTQWFALSTPFSTDEIDGHSRAYRCLFHYYVVSEYSLAYRQVLKLSIPLQWAASYLRQRVRSKYCCFDQHFDAPTLSTHKLSAGEPRFIHAL